MHSNIQVINQVFSQSVVKRVANLIAGRKSLGSNLSPNTSYRYNVLNFRHSVQKMEAWDLKLRHCLVISRPLQSIT